MGFTGGESPAESNPAWQVRGAARVILIDKVPERLSFAQSKIPGLEIIDNSKVRVCCVSGHHCT